MLYQLQGFPHSQLLVWWLHSSTYLQHQILTLLKASFRFSYWFLVNWQLPFFFFKKKRQIYVSEKCDHFACRHICIIFSIWWWRCLAIFQLLATLFEYIFQMLLSLLQQQHSRTSLNTSNKLFTQKLKQTQFLNTPQLLYNTIVGVQSTVLVSWTTKLGYIQTKNYQLYRRMTIYGHFSIKSLYLWVRL